MNFIETLKSVDLVLATNEVPLVVGESGIGKTALARKLAQENNWSLVVIDGNLLKEGEIGGLPTVENYAGGKTTLYAVHYKLREIFKDEEEIKLVDDLIASKVKSEAKSKMFCETSRVYDIYDKCLTEEILKRKKQ